MSVIGVASVEQRWGFDCGVMCFLSSGLDCREETGVGT